MKKILLFSMAAMLLSLSLNAQLVPANNQRFSKALNNSGSNATFGAGHGTFGALGAGEYCVGPFNNYINTYTATSFHLDNYTQGEVLAGIQMTKDEIQSHFGDQVVGFRFAVARTTTVYGFFCYIGDSEYIDGGGSLFSSTFGTNERSMSAGWHEYRFQNPIDFTLTADQTRIWFGIDFNQEYDDQYYMTHLAVNSSSQTHNAVVFMTYQGSFGGYSLNLGGDMCVQLILKPKPTAEAPVFSMDENYTITATCGNAYKAYVNGVEVTMPYTVQQTDQEQTIVVTGYGYGTGMQNSQTVTQTFVVPARSGDPAPEGYTELGSFGQMETIDFTGIMFCDQPWGKTHANNHPAKYTYWLEEVVDANSSSDPQKTNTIDIPVYKTGSDVKGYYNLSEIASDTDHHLQVDVLNADVDLSLQNESMIYYYTLDRGKTTLPNEHIAHLQNNANSNFYTEMSDALGYQGETYTATQGNPALIDRWDHLDVKTGEHNQDYMAYVPVIWAWGDGTLDNKRVDWDNSHKHNSYGSPYYKTGVGDVSFNAGTKIIAQTGTGSTAVWKDGTDDCCLYNVIIDANGYLPTTVNTVEYEPYMFRVWVEGNGLRNYAYENNQFLPADGRPTEILLYEGEYQGNGGDIRLNIGSEVVGNYGNWITFGGLRNNFTPTLRVRFYYKVPSENVTTLKGSGRDFYAVEESGYQPEWTTGVVDSFTGAQVVSTTYVNMQGMQSSTPFDGVNIMVTRYSDGTTTTTKVIK